MNATSRRTNSRISPSNVAAAWSASLNFSTGFRLGAYISGPGFSGTAPSRSLLLMVNSYKAQCKLRGSLCRLIAACDLGGRGNRPRRAGYARLFHELGAQKVYQWSLKPVLMLTADCLTHIRNRGGNLEWPVSFCSALSGVVRYGVVAGAGPAGAERRAGWEMCRYETRRPVGGLFQVRIRICLLF